MASHHCSLIANALLVLSLCVLAVSGQTSPVPADERVVDLQRMQDKSSDGVIHFTPKDFAKYAGGKKRPYSLICFLTADHLLDKPQLHLRKLRSEYGYLGVAFKKKEESKAGKVFFVEMEFAESREIFSRLKIQTLPSIFRLSPSVAIDPESLIKIRDDDSMRHEDFQRYPWTAEDMATFVTDKTGLVIGKVDKPSIFTSPAFPVMVLVIIGMLGVVGYKLYYAEFMKNLIIWASGSIFILWFSVSGGMHNIIRGIPFSTMDPNRGVVYFLPGAQGQLGAEGFYMGAMYTAVGLSISFLTYAAPKISNARSQRIASYISLAVGLSAFVQVFNVYAWKTGYHLRSYL